MSDSDNEENPDMIELIMKIKEQTKKQMILLMMEIQKNFAKKTSELT